VYWLRFLTVAREDKWCSEVN